MPRAFRSSHGERLGLLGRNGAGKIVAPARARRARSRPTPATWCARPACAIASLPQDVPLGLSGSVHRFLREACGADGRARPTWRIEARIDQAARDLTLDLEAGLETLSAGARAPRPAGGGAGARREPAPARRAHEPSRHRRHHLSRGVAAAPRGRARVRDARSRLPAQRRDAHPRSRSRHDPQLSHGLRRLSSSAATKSSGSRPSRPRCSTRSWRRRRRGCAAASRRAARATRAACARSRRCASSARARRDEVGPRARPRCRRRSARGRSSCACENVDLRATAATPIVSRLHGHDPARRPRRHPGARTAAARRR